MSKNVKIYQHNKNIENKLKYFEKCVDKCTSMYILDLTKEKRNNPTKKVGREVQKNL